MTVSLSELRLKEVIDIVSGEKIGYIDDALINSDTSEAEALVIYGRPRLFGLLGRGEDIIIRCSEIKVIGRETVLVSIEKESSFCENSTKKKSFVYEKSL